MHIATKIIKKHGFDHPIVHKTFITYLKDILLTAEERDYMVFKKAHTKDMDQDGHR